MLGILDSVFFQGLIIWYPTLKLQCKKDDVKLITQMHLLKISELISFSQLFIRFLQSTYLFFIEIW